MPVSENIKEALNTYKSDLDSLRVLIQNLSSEFGSDWRNHAIGVLSELTPDEQIKMDHALRYQDALTAWSTVHTYLAQTEPLPIDRIQSELSGLSQSLSFFGEPGAQAITHLQEKLAIQSQSAENSVTSDNNTSDLYTERNENPVLSETEESLNPKEEKSIISETNEETESTDIDATVREETITSSETKTETPSKEDSVPPSETVWAVEKVLKQVTLTQDVQAWVAARCIDLGNIEVFAYPHYPFVVDLMKQTLQDVQSLLSDTSLADEINRAFPEGTERLRHIQSSLEEDLKIAYRNTDSEETPLTRESLQKSDVKRLLGQIDTSENTEYLGPAPDGFETVIDPYEELDEQPIKDSYQKIENVVFSENRNHPSEKTAAIEKNTSQTMQNGVKRNLSFSFGNRQNKPTGN